MLEDGVDGAPNVEQDRQAELGGEPELAGEHLFLPIVVEAGDEMIEADLAHRDQARVTGMARERVTQVPEIVVAGPVGAHRMDAERVGQLIAMRQLAHPREVADIDRRDNDLGDPGGPRAGDDGVAIGVELGCVEVAMGVDPHGAMMPGSRERSAL
jgi:hypothetical protein